VVILGIDPGTRLCGYGAVEADGTRLLALTFGVIESRDDSCRRACGRYSTG